MAKAKRATWWKMLYHQRAAIESIPNEEVGAGLKAAFQYFDGEEVNADNLSSQAFTVFFVMRPYIWPVHPVKMPPGNAASRRGRYVSISKTMNFVTRTAPLSKN